VLVVIVRASALDQTKRCCPLDHGTVVTIVKLPSQNFSQAVYGWSCFCVIFCWEHCFLKRVRFHLRQ